MLPEHAADEQLFVSIYFLMLLAKIFTYTPKQKVEDYYSYQLYVMLTHFINMIDTGLLTRSLNKSPEIDRIHT